MSDAVTCHCGVTAFPTLIMGEANGQATGLVPSCPSCGAPHSFATESPSAKIFSIRPQIAVAPKQSSDVMQIIQERIAFLDAELAKATSYSAERKRLSRMLAAAAKVKP